MKEINAKNLTVFEDLTLEFKKLYIKLRLVLDAKFDVKMNEFQEEIDSLLLDILNNLEQYSTDLGILLNCIYNNEIMNAEILEE